MRKKIIAGFELMTLIIATFAFSFLVYCSNLPVVSASTISQPSECCEKTKQGAFCINTDAANCDNSFKTSPTSCDSTSYCKLGTCYNSKEGICMENTPQRVCQEQGGTWDERSADKLPQCQLGCCVIVDQAAFVPLVRCKRLSTLFGVEIDYRKDITSEIECIATAQSQDMGACVYEKDFERICKFTTRKDCSAENIVESINGTNVTLSSEKRFYKGYLCSAEELNTACARQATTGCYQQKVYWFDSCGNRENVYSSDKEKSWNNGYAAEPDKICSANDGSNKNCGNCDYLLGSRCSEWTWADGSKPASGNYFCKKTTCKDRYGNERKNGESWCVYDSSAIGNSTDPVGSRYYRELCVDGEVRVEPCADYRNEICLQSSADIGGETFGFAACRANRWQDCVLQTKEKDCKNIDKRDCLWIKPVEGMILGGGSEQKTFSNPTSTFSNPASPVTGSAIAPITGMASSDNEEKETKTNRPNGICVPNFPPGLKFWQDGDAKAICGQASAKCIVTFEKKIIGGKSCVSGCECLEPSWAMEANRVCASLGDCGAYINYKGKFTDDGYEWKVDGKDKKFSQNDVNKILSAFTGKSFVAIIVGFAMLPFASGAPAASQPATPVITPTMITGESATDFLKKNQPSTILNPAGAATPPIVPPAIPAALKANWATSQAQIGTATYSGFKSNINGMDYFVYNDKGAIRVAEWSDPGKGLGIWRGSSKSAANLGLTENQITAIKQATGAGAQTYPRGMLASMLGLTAGEMASALLTGLETAAMAAGIGALIGSLAGMNPDNTKALSLALGSGAFVWQTIVASEDFSPIPLFNGVTLGDAAPFIGIAVAATIFILMYKKESTQVVEFHCLPWQAPSGGNECEKCNDADLPCSEYRCKSLGQNCELVNKGTEDEKCVNVNPRDVEPPQITPNEQELGVDYQYTDVKNFPPGPGFKIKGKTQECVKAFTPLNFGINTDEPAQCKIDINHTESFDEMSNYLGGSNLYLYNHTEQLSLPGPSNLEGNITLFKDGKYTLFIRCKDKNGNENEAEYAVSFCVDPAPDNTAPQIKATSIASGSCVASNTDLANVEFYVNEPAECKWSHEDQSYENMQNSMTCSNYIYQINAMQLYTCKAQLTGIGRNEEAFYVRCKDQPGKPDNERNVNKQSYKFSLRGSTDLKIKNLLPNGTIYGAVNPAPVTLSVETLFGCNNGKAFCYYSTTDNDADYIMFFDTNKEDGMHTQRQDLASGSYTYYYKCVDSGGNVAKNSTTFKLEIETSAPVIARIYEQDKMLKIITVRKSECSYTFDNCDFLFEEGTQMPYANSTMHVAEWKDDKTYYIKCRDEFKNEEADCSAIVQGVENFL